MSVAPRDIHEAQVQFALERGLPAMLGVLSTNRLPFPSRAFDMAHCSRCLVPWTSYGTYIWIFKFEAVCTYWCKLKISSFNSQWHLKAQVILKFELFHKIKKALWKKNCNGKMTYRFLEILNCLCSSSGKDSCYERRLE